jgi:hypothetical protein
MSDIRQLREQIDACRPGSDDLALPGLAELAQAAAQDRAVAEELARSQQFDKAVAAAMHDVPIPAGLLDRLLDAAKAADTVERAIAQVPPSSPIAISPVPPAPRLTRRHWLIAGGSLALAALVGWTIVVLRPGQLPIDAQAELNQSVDRWFRDAVAAPNAKAWVAANKSPLPPAFAVPPALVGTPLAWRHIQASGTGWSGKGVAIDMAIPGKRRAVLFVIAPKVQFSVAASPYTRLRPSGGLQAVAWQSQSSNLLYVLVLEDAAQSMDQLFRPRSEA